MDQELFNPQSSFVSSSRIIYTPSAFARTSLLHLQEVGSLQAVHPHVSQRSDLVSFLCFVVLSGEGELSYEGQTYQLSEGDCVFIDCRKAYSHATSDNLWSLQWCHFYAPSLPAVYEKYKERGGRPVFHPADIKPFTTLLTDIYDLASSSDYIRDMRINEKLGTLLTLLMEQSWHPESVTVSRKRMELVEIKNYLDGHYWKELFDYLEYDPTFIKLFVTTYNARYKFEDDINLPVTVRSSHMLEVKREVKRAIIRDKIRNFWEK